MKHLHLTLVLVSVVLFYFRFTQVRLRNKTLPKVLNILPHIIDTLLLLSAIALCVIIQQYPLVADWLTFKVAFVIGYIGFAIAAMKTELKSKSVVFLSLSSVCLVFAAFFAVNKGQIF